MLTRNVTAVREIPGEPGQTMTFRQLGWRQLSEAEEMRSATVLRNLRTMGGELLRDLQGIDRAKVEDEAATQTSADPLTKYDQAAVLKAGIAAWSYPEKVTAENIDALDAETARWAALQILEMGMPPLDKEAESRFFDSPAGSTVMAAAHPMNGSSL